MAAIDWTHIIRKYKGLWVALRDDEKTVISSGKTLKQAANKAKEQGFDQPIFFRVPNKLIPYIGTIN